MIAKGIRCSGKVQGVFFRATTKSIAEDLGVFGWVKNESDGTVLIHAEGELAQLDQLIQWCKEGPEYASVSEVKTWDKEPGGFSDFDIRRD